MSNPQGVAKELQDAGEQAVTRAFRLALGEVERLAKQPKMVPFGFYGATRGKSGKPGGDLKRSLRVEFSGLRGTSLTAFCVSDLAYAEAQHERVYHHPGKYTGRPGPQYAAAYFRRAYVMVFEGAPDPLGMVQSGKTFDQILGRSMVLKKIAGK
jgi:hypothetical protein